MTSPDPSSDPQLPAKLAEDLSALYRADIPIPAETSAAIVAAAAAGIARRRRFSRVLRWGTGIAAAAAVVLVVLVHRGLLAPPAGSSSANQVAILQPPPSGQSVDILPAFQLARALAAGQKVSSAWDRNGDGKVDQRDVDAWAHEAVRLTPEVTR